MEKEKYVTPKITIITTEVQQCILAGSGIEGSMDGDDSDWETVKTPKASGGYAGTQSLSKYFNGDDDDWENN
ncbi:hypothetical protein HMPREF9296_0677 [Prevotella disiens FB035-09AN]|uniref:Uncharacterized protein n=1 Tax=Prevotella disiens FB035-09AN TaxID=866771 RepID=E1KUJ5_9BACT|nr:hypothetical protein [Prevotella disiens]EFL44873.1 hypothetical protein HMPREF9296_0677 [Prevotella disiens FB035-09AN]